MSFGDRARKGLAGLVLLGASAGLGGCGALIDFAAQENAAHVRGHYEVEAAKIRAGQNGERLQSQMPSNDFFTCNFAGDSNNDGVISDDEIKNRKDIFGPGESVTICAKIYGCRGRVLSCEVISPTEGSREVTRVLIPSNYFILDVGADVSEKDPSVEMSVVWKVNNAYAGTSKFNINNPAYLSKGK